MPSKRKLMDMKNVQSLNISSNKSGCDCGCDRCENEIRLLQEKLLEMYDLLGVKVTRQSLNETPKKVVTATKERQLSVKGCGCKKSCTTRCGCYKKDLACGELCKCDKNICGNTLQIKAQGENKENENETDCLLNIKTCSPITKRKVKTVVDDTDCDALSCQQEEEFDPMKPRHQIPRSPLPVKSGLSESDDRETELRPNCLSNFDVSLASSSIKSMASDLPEDLQKPIIDWEEHQKNLKKCPKCERKFLPVRLEKHKPICKGI